MGSKILVVDDDQMNLMRARMILSKEGYEVVTADSGAAALDILSQETVALVLLDIEMPEMSGVETLEKLRKTENKDMQPVMFMTGTYGEEEQAHGERLGVLGCIQKPFLPPVLLEQVKKVIE